MDDKRKKLLDLIKSAKQLSQTNKHGAQDVIAMRARNIAIEALYLYDGRDNPAHPQHHHYTGLNALDV